MCVVRAYRLLGVDHDRDTKDHSSLVGYLLLGRNTPRTVAIRNVFISLEHRKRGLAEMMVRAVTRACFGASSLLCDDMKLEDPVDVEMKVGVPGWGTKSAVCLLVSKPAVARIYRNIRALWICGRPGRQGLSTQYSATGRSRCYVQELRDVTMASSAG